MDLNTSDILDPFRYRLRSVYKNDSLFENAESNFILESFNPFQISVENTSDHSEKQINPFAANRSLLRLHCDTAVLNTIKKDLAVEEDVSSEQNLKLEPTSKPKLTIVDGKDFNDIPTTYMVLTLEQYEYRVMGVCIDKRIVPGFKYKVRPIDSLEYVSSMMFDDNALKLLSIGRGYSRRITFAPDFGALNNNINYFWSDSRIFGFAFQLEVVSIGEKYTLCGIDYHPVGHVKIIKIQSPQQEIKHTVLHNNSVEKSVMICVLGEVEWYFKNEISVVMISGIAMCIKHAKESAKVTRIISATIGNDPNHTYTLTPGIDNKKRCILVSGATCNDVPITYTITGLEAYELPVIGTYLDPKIMPGFYYKVRPVQSNVPLFDNRALRLLSIGMGYSKRITFSPDCLNKSDNYFWTDSWSGGFGFELRAVSCGTNFSIKVIDQLIGHASVFRADKPQHEKNQIIVKGSNGLTVIKYVHVDMTCCVMLNMAGNKSVVDQDAHGQIMRISGTAVLTKKPNCNAILSRIENIGLDSQLNLLFLTQQHSDLIFYPI